MKAVLKTSPSAPSAHLRLLIAGTSAALALAAMSFANTAHARDNVTFSVGIGVPGVVVGASNAYPVYTQPQVVYTQPQVIYTQPRPVYVQPAPVYYQPAPVYYPAPRVYVAPQPIYYGRPHGWKHGHHEGGWQNQGDGRGYYRQGYAPVYYQR
jgi:hypothetical protein